MKRAAIYARVSTAECEMPGHHRKLIANRRDHSPKTGNCLNGMSLTETVKRYRVSRATVVRLVTKRASGRPV